MLDNAAMLVKFDRTMDFVNDLSYFYRAFTIPAMVLNYIWIGFFLAGFLVALVRVAGYYFRDFFAEHLNIIFGAADLNVFSDIVQGTFSTAKYSVEICLGLIGIMAFWLGIMKIGEKGGAIRGLSRAVNPFFRRIFPELPANHPAFGSMIMNISANMLGLDNAATPLGIKAMEDLQQANKTKDTASNAMIMFIVLNTAGMTVIPVTILALRASAGAANPTDIFMPLLIATFSAAFTGFIAVSIMQKINIINRVILGYLLGIIGVIAFLIWYMVAHDKQQVQTVTGFAGNFIIFSIIITFIILGIVKKINLYESFIEGAKEGFTIAVKIIPYLVAMLVAIGVFRASGAMDLLMKGISRLVGQFGVNTDFVDALPVAFMKPLSGSGARGLMVDAMKTFGADSFVGRLSCIFQGTTETTFYVLAVYFGAVNISKTRYAAGCALIADLAGMVVAIFVAYLFFH